MAGSVVEDGITDSVSTISGGGVVCVSKAYCLLNDEPKLLEPVMTDKTGGLLSKDGEVLFGTFNWESVLGEFGGVFSNTFSIICLFFLSSLFLNRQMAF